MLKMVNLKPICHPKDTALVRLRFLLIKIGFPIILTMIFKNIQQQQIFHIFYNVLPIYQTFCPQKSSESTLRFIYLYASYSSCMHLKTYVLVFTKSKASVFHPTALKGCQGIVFTHGVRRAGGRAALKSLSGLYLKL